MSRSKVPAFDLEQRRPVWNVLSEQYLDTEFEESEFQHMASVIRNSPYTFDEVGMIDRYEVFPVLYFNLLSPAGEWGCWDEQWLTDTIIKELDSKLWTRYILTKVVYKLFQWKDSDWWRRLRTAYNQLVPE